MRNHTAYHLYGTQYQLTHQQLQLPAHFAQEL